MKARLSGSVYCPKCGNLMHWVEDSIQCLRFPHCSLHGVAFERPTIELVRLEEKEQTDDTNNSPQ